MSFVLSAATVDLFDIDGTFRRPFTVGEQPGVPHPELVELLRQLSRSGDPIAVTGMSPEGLCRLERAADFPFVEAWVSYALRRRKVDGTWRNTGDPSQVAAFEEALPFLRQVAEENEGLLDDDEACFTAFLPPDSEAFHAARTAIQGRLHQQVESGVLRALFNPDGGITVLPASGGKHLAVDHFARKGRKIRLAAGDTRSDLPMLEAAEFPIVTITNEGDAPHPDLVEVIRRRGVGYVCEHHNGVGLVDAILVARSAGVVTF